MPNQQAEVQVALVTGGGRGLGRATCLALAEEGLRVLVADRNGESARRVAREIEDRGAYATAIELDVTNDHECREAMRIAQSEYGGLDVLVNNAGVDRTVSIEEMEIEDFDRVIATNLRGPFLLAKEAFPMLKSRGRGHIINIVSTAAKRAWPKASAYHSSKWGLLGLSHAMHVEGRQHGIKVTAVVCGGMRTPFLLERFPDIDLSTLQEPENVARVVKDLLRLPEGTVIPELMVIPMTETSWP